MRQRVALWLCLITALVTVSACSQIPVPPPMGGPAAPVEVPEDAADQATPAPYPVDPGFPERHPAFTKHFTDPLYDDEAGEFAPFGTDEGSDTLYEWADRRRELNRCTTVRWLLRHYDMAGALDDPEQNGPDVDAFVIGAGFGLILLTGHIDSEGKQLTLDALHRTYSYYADSNPREQPVMIRDLEAFPATDCTSPTPKD